MVVLCYMAQKWVVLLHSPVDVVYLGVSSPSDDSDGSRNFWLSLVKVHWKRGSKTSWKRRALQGELPYHLFDVSPEFPTDTNTNQKTQPGWPGEKAETSVMGKRAVRCEMPSLLYSTGSFLTPDPQVKPRQGLQCAKGRWCQQQCVSCWFCTQAPSCPFQHCSPGTIWNLVNDLHKHRHHPSEGQSCFFSNWHPVKCSLETVPCSLFPRGLSEFRQFPWIVSIQSALLGHKKMLFFVLHARYCQKRILSRFFLFMFCRGILDHQASQEQRDPKVMW